MLRKFSALTRPVAHLARQNQYVGVRCMGDFKPDTVVVQEHQSGISAMPVPQGSWEEHHNQRNSRYNMYLGASIILLIASLFGANAAGVFTFHEIKDIKKVKINVE